MSSRPDDDQLAAQRDALTRTCPKHNTPPGMLCLTGAGVAICDDRMQQQRPAYDPFLLGVQACMAVVRTVAATGGGLEQVERHLADLGGRPMAHEPGA